MKSSSVQKILFFLVLILFSIFSNGQYAIFLAMWIFTTLLLFAVRKFSKWNAFLLAFVTIGIGNYIGFDVIPFLPASISIILTIFFSIFAALPYFIDAFFSKKRTSFLSTLIFPCSVVLVEYIYHQFNQYGTWGHTAYSQQSQHILLQSISVFGMGYITFLITWFASVCNWAYEHKHQWNRIKKGVFIYGFTLVLTLVFGSYRVQFQKSTSETIRVASISALDSLGVNFSIFDLNKKEVANQTRAEAKKQTTALNQYLFDKSIAEAQSGAKIVFWAEGNGVVLKEDEQDLYKKASKLATEQNIYLGIGIAVLDHSKTKFLENKFVIFSPEGKMVIDYWKGISVPGAEAPISNNKITGIQKITTNYGVISGAICFDLDFPKYLQQAKGSDILLAPSNDYKEIDPLHTDMAKFRAIEQGFNLIRHTSNGLSIGTDYTGKVLSEMDHYTDTNKVLITQLPTKGVKTIYSIIGDLFIVLCLLLLITTIFILKNQTKKTMNYIP